MRPPAVSADRIEMGKPVDIAGGSGSYSSKPREDLDGDYRENSTTGRRLSHIHAAELDQTFRGGTRTPRFLFILPYRGYARPLALCAEPIGHALPEQAKSGALGRQTGRERGR